MSENGFVIVFVLGAVQGVFLAVVLASRRRNRLSNRLLAVAMLVFSLDLAMAVYHGGGYDAVWPALIGLDAPAGFLYGPLFSLYARTVSEGAVSLRRRDLWHFIPFALFLAYLLPFLLQSGPDKLSMLRDPSLSPSLQALSWINPLKMVHGVVYVGVLIRLLRRHRARVKDTFSSIEHLTLNWLYHLTIGLVLMVGGAVVLFGLSYRTGMPVLGLDPTGPYDDLTLLGLTVFIYAIGYLGLRQPEIFAPHRADPPPPEPVTQAEEKPRYSRSGMDPATAARYKTALVDFMEAEKPYRRGDLTLQELAEALSLSTHNLTEVINTQLGLSFYDFVNGYRVQEVQARLADPASAHLTLLSIGLDAGFNAKSSFNAVFKKHTGMTPSQYRQQLGGSIEAVIPDPDSASPLA